MKKLNIKIIPDELLIKIPVKDNNEKLVNLRKYCPEIIINIDPQSKRIQQLSKNTCYIRKSVALKLCKAQKLLPVDYYLMIWEAHRPLKVQKKMYSDLYNKLKKKHYNWTKEKIKQETDKFVAPIEIIPPHSTGGTIDLTIIGPNGKQLNMGTKLDTFNKKSHTFSKVISKISMNNRKLLIKVMTKSGFVNYPIEWWHWSYGDRYWAATLKKKFSIYKGI